MKICQYHFKVHVILSLLFLFFACELKDKSMHTDSIKIDVSVMKSINLKGEEIKFDSILLKPTSIEIRGQNIITRNAFTENIFHIYNIADNCKVGEKIASGQGPNEMLFPLFSENNNDHISIFEHSKQKIFTFNSNEFIRNTHPRITNEVNLGKRVNYAYILKNRSILGTTSNDINSLLTLFHSDGSVDKQFGEYPKSNLKLNDFMKIGAYDHRSIAFNENKNCIMIFYFFTDLIDIYDFGGNKIKSLQGIDSFLPLFNPNGTSIEGKTRVAFWGQPIFDDKYCYILYSGSVYKDFTEEIKSIYVFDWGGKLIQVLNLDRSVFTFSIDFDNKFIYGITNTPDVSIMRFELPNSL
ncbi:BF3164 family lipoprotein [Dysgonomonas mossii]|uniref:BF3164 family lipoprotein n=1 Tax=Dysgonomonas mossii TaxID=163665 RepID=UPI003993872C